MRCQRCCFRGLSTFCYPSNATLSHTCLFHIALFLKLHTGVCIPDQAEKRIPPKCYHKESLAFAALRKLLPFVYMLAHAEIPCMQWWLFRDEKPADALTVRHGPETDDYNRDFIERDEKRLADLGRKTVEMYVIAHIIADLEVRSQLRSASLPWCPTWHDCTDHIMLFQGVL